MAAFLLDTNIIIDILRGKRDRVTLVRELVAQENSMACCAVTVTEIYAGLRPQELDKTERLLRHLDYMEISQEIAKKAGLLKQSWARRGVTLSFPDVMIAAVAISGNLTLITGNRKDFPMPELRLYPLPRLN